MKTYSRRVVLRQGAQLLSAACALPLVSHAATPTQSCVQPASQGLLQSLNYMAVSSDSAKACRGCAFFTADSANGSCGNCMIATGPVDATGHCDSWTAKS